MGSIPQRRRWFELIAGHGRRTGIFLSPRWDFGWNGEDATVPTACAVGYYLPTRRVAGIQLVGAANPPDTGIVHEKIAAG